jgi:uncharacterized protein (DUF885 family)
MMPGRQIKRWIYKAAAFLLVFSAVTGALPASGAADDLSAAAELKAIVDADQADRKDWREWSKLSAAESQAIAKRDAERLARVRELLQQGKVKSAEDFDHASLIFQHGVTADDYLTAHELALIRLLKSPRTLDNTFCLSEDRYLIRSGESSVLARRER